MQLVNNFKISKFDFKKYNDKKKLKTKFAKMIALTLVSKEISR